MFGIATGYDSRWFRWEMENQVVGKGDTRTRRGKIVRGTFGNTRPRKKKRNEDNEDKKR